MAKFGSSSSAGSSKPDNKRKASSRGSRETADADMKVPAPVQGADIDIAANKGSSGSFPNAVD